MCRHTIEVAAILEESLNRTSELFLIAEARFLETADVKSAGIFWHNRSNTQILHERIELTVVQYRESALILGVGYGDLLASDASLVQRMKEERDVERKLDSYSVFLALLGLKAMALARLRVTLARPDQRPGQARWLWSGLALAQAMA
ncbi:hypothetical protein B0H14DRAFT_2559259 [Mycena olivaceomarginata]|nr:hypothetical protein B0H14DRAFT_2559259 [Mycena olivaceomarginata]